MPLNSPEWLEVFSSLVDNAPDYIVVVDREHRIRFVNRLEAGLTGSDVIGVPVEDFAPGEDRERIGRAIDSVFATGRHGSYELRISSESGDYWYSTRLGPVLSQGRVVFVTLITTDVTDQRRAGERMRLNEERFRTLIQHAPEAITILDLESHRFSMVNPNACELFGLSEEELLTKGPRELSPPFQPDGRASADGAAEAIQTALEGHVPVFEWTHLHSDGSEVPCEIRLVRLPDPSRVLVRGSITDISERKRAEAERERLAERLLHSQKMEALGQLTGGVAHDFNNLLTVILGNLELLGLQLSDREDLVELTQMATTAGMRASSLTHRLLAFSRKQPLKPAIVDLNDLMGDMRGLLERTLGETVQVKTIGGEGLWPCQVDPGQMENAILNLALNGRDAMQDGGQLTFETANVVLAADRETDELAPGEYVMLSVTDEGEGMTAEVLAHALEPFFTTKQFGRGSGLGLSMVYGFVLQSGGGLELESRPGQGSRVRIHLPRAEGIPRRSTQDASDQEPHGAGERVLLVEDEERVRVLAKTFLEGLGYRTIAATDGPDALALMEAGEAFDVLFTDVVLPKGMDGFELARKARELLPDLPVLYTSGYAEEFIRQHGHVDPEVELLVKPFTRAKLARRLRVVLERGDSGPREPSRLGP